MFLDSKLFYESYNPGSSYSYGRMGSAVRGKYGVQTSGSSTTVTATDGTPFGPVTVGSTIVFMTPRPDGRIIRKVTAKASPTSITISSAATIPAGTAFFFYPFKEGTTDNDGWHLVNDLSAISVIVDVATLGSTSIDVNIQGGGGPFSTPFTPTTSPASPVNITATGRTVIEVTSVVQSLRVGLKANTPGTDVVTVRLAGEQLVSS